MADDEITDLTEEEGSGDAGKGKKRGGKAPKEPKEPKALKEKRQKGEKVKTGAGGVIIIMILVLVILIGGFSAALYFDIFSAREITADLITEPLLNVIIWLDPDYLEINQRLEAERETQEKIFEERTEDLDGREEVIVIREDSLGQREQQLEWRAQELDRREEHIMAMYERTVPLWKRDMTEEELEDMLSLSRLYSQMSPEDAAARLVALHDPRDVAGILYYMNERNAASILAAFEVRYAAQITEILLYS